MFKYDHLLPDMVRLKNEGMNLTEISRTLKIPSATTCRYMHAHGLNQPKKEYCESTDRKFREAISRSEIADLRNALKLGNKIPILSETEEMDDGTSRKNTVIQYWYVTAIPAKGKIICIGKSKNKTTSTCTYIDILVAMRWKQAHDANKDAGNE